MPSRTSVLAVLLATPALLVGLWLGAWHLWMGAGWWLVVAGLVMMRRWPGVLGVSALVLLGTALVPWCVWRYSQRVETLTAAYLEGGPGALGVDDKVAVWGLNLVMAAGGAVAGFPEVAVETALLAVPRGPQLTWHSERFPRCAPKVGAVIARQQAAARRGQTSFAPVRVAWRYGESTSSVRAALALNPVTVRTEREHDVLHVRATVPVDYPPHAPLVFARIGDWSLTVEEGLFHALEEEGWLMPYALTYATTVGLDDPSPPMCEAWGVHVGRALGVAPF